MKNTKKLFNLVLILSSGLLLASCGDTKQSAKPNSENKTSTTQKTSTTTNPSTGTATTNPGDASVSDKDVSKIAIKTNPTKMEYILGETFSAEGGVLTVTYKNKSTADLSMTDSRITYSALNTSAVGDKTVKITFGGKSCTLRGIKVTREKFTVTFNANGGSDVASMSVEKGTTFEAPAVPTKAGFDFDGWYTDEALTISYDFSSSVEQAFTLYAKWLTSGAVKHVVTFDYG